MKICRYASYFTLLLLACLLASGVRAEPRPRVIGVAALANILFVGNSFTFYINGLHNHLRYMMKAGGHEIRTMTLHISDSGAQPVLFMTWARSTRPEQTAPLNEHHTAAGNETGALVIPVGLAFERSTKEKNGIVLRMKDRRHPTLAGSYLAACTFCTALFGESPVRHTYTAGLDFRTAWTLQRIAAETVEAYYGRQLNEAD